MTIGECIKNYRKEKNLTQTKLAALSNISRTYLADIEANRYNPSISTLTDIANALGLTSADLMQNEIVPSKIKPAVMHDGLSEKELAMLDLFRSAPLELQDLALAALESRQAKRKARKIHN